MRKPGQHENGLIALDIFRYCRSNYVPMSLFATLVTSCAKYASLCNLRVCKMRNGISAACNIEKHGEAGYEASMNAPYECLKQASAICGMVSPQIARPHYTIMRVWKIALFDFCSYMHLAHVYVYPGRSCDQFKRL